MKTLRLIVIAIALLVFSGINFVYAQTASHVMGKFPFSSEIENLMMRSCGRINDLGDVDPQVTQYVKQNNPKIEVSNDNAQELFWSTLYTKFVSHVPEFKSLGGKNETINISMGGNVATSCPPIQGGNATFQVNGNQLTYRLGFYSDSQAFYYKSISFIHTSQNQTRLEDTVYPMGPDFGLQSPLEQLRSGITAEHIQCKISFALIIKSEDGTPACVKPQTAQKLVERGWGTHMSSNSVKMPSARISQDEAIQIVESDLQNRANGSKILAIVDTIGDRQSYVPFLEFQARNGTLPLVFVYQNGTLLTVNNASLKISGRCNQPYSGYCGYLPPFNLDYKHRLLYGLDIRYGTNSTDQQPAFYAVDAISGDIVDSYSLRSKASEKTQAPSLFMDCQTPYPKKDTGIAVLYMPMNSIGKVCVRYSNFNDTPAPIGIRIFEANNLNQNTREISTWASANVIPKGNATVVYTIKTGNQAGFYGMTIFCVGMPLAIGYDNDSRLVADDFPWLGQTFNCPIQTYDFHITGLDGIGVKYIPYP